MEDEEFNILKKLASNIIKVLKNYYNGKTYLAYINLYDALKDIEDNLLIRQFSRDNLPFFFRARIKEDINCYTKKEMFHIPFSMRTRVNSYRYSIAGHPTLYLGNSLYVCWNELRKASFENLNVVRYELKRGEKISLLDFGYRPQDIYKAVCDKIQEDITESKEFVGLDLIDFMKNKKNLVNYLITYPLLASCSVKVKNDAHVFKPEYIIPQSLLQYVIKVNNLPQKGKAEKKEDVLYERNDSFEEIHGVRYFSVSTEYGKYNNDVNPIEFIHNYALPAFELKKDSDLCKILLSKFDSTEPVSWSLLNIIHPSLLHSSYLDYFKSEIEVIKNHNPIPYNRTDFYAVENYLLQKNTRVNNIV